MENPSTENPFQAPSPITLVATVNHESTAAHQVIAAWESRRLMYNLVVGLSGIAALLLLTFHSAFFGIVGLIFAGFFGIVANGCFCLGPLVELYLAYFLKRPQVPIVRTPMFLIGTAMSVGLIGLMLLDALSSIP